MCTLQQRDGCGAQTNHSRHLNVADQARCCCERGCQSAADGNARQWPSELTSFPWILETLIILHDRYKFFGIASSRQLSRRFNASPPTTA